MGIKKTEVTVIECDACKAHQTLEAKQPPPESWTEHSITIKFGPAPYTKNLHLCPTCSLDKEQAVEMYKKSIGQ